MGWRSAGDNKKILLAVDYCRDGGLLSCRFYSTNQPITYVGVPERIYGILLRTPYAGAYYRKYVLGKYPILGGPRHIIVDDSAIADAATKAKKRKAKKPKTEPKQLSFMNMVPLRREPYVYPSAR